MKESTRLLLEEEIKSGKYAYEKLKNPEDYFEFIKNHKDFGSLFEIYLAEEFGDVESFFQTFSHKDTQQLEFFHFLKDHVDELKITSQVLEDNFMDSAERLLIRDVSKATSKVTSYLYTKGIIETKQSFVDMALEIAGKEGNLLEIGSGADLPITSLLFARELGEVSSMDKFGEHWSSLDFFKKMGVNATSKYFDKNTDISGFQTIVSQKACGGAISVIDRLANNGGEQVYFQQLCDCESPSSEDKMKNLLDWLWTKDRGMKSFSVKSTPTGQKELHVNGLDNDNGLRVTYVTNSPMDIDDIAEIISENYC